MTELSKSYDPSDVESRWFQRWLDGGWFHADASSDRPPYTIVIPPPNVTGSLHMGHALTNTIQDILTRHKRMCGYEALWLPGTDHAGIATQTVVERDLAKQGLSRHELGREAFLEHVWAWKEKYGNRITTQLKRLGSSLDWSRERFTMDEGLSRAVREVFVRLYEEGLIYRDERLVNWDPVARTVLSDLEVEQEEEDGFLWHIAYPVAGTDDRLVVATTRPETLLGDTAVAIHPDDPRYTHLHGLEVELPLTGRRIPIVCDPQAADMTFGSGAVKITPAHDFNDFETGRRNELPSITVLDLDARINDSAPEAYRGLDRYEARRVILDDLRALGLLVKEEPYRLAPGRSQRSGAIVEPLSIGRQWFVKMEPLAKPAIAAVRDHDIEFIPQSWEKTYFHWMENIRDWCISRQLWWGHRIPAWTCDACDHVTVSRTDATACGACGSTSIHQDEDVLDTWFSSALWPFSTLGWPDDTADLKKFYPTTVMETGFDIIFFWVARMIFMGLHFMDEVPFRTVFFHAMVRDKHGNKMSKTRGNVIDPLHVIDGVRPADLTDDERETYDLLLRDFPDGIAPQGADALRFTLATYAAAGRDIKLDVRRVEGYRAFMNKLWNGARFALMNLEGYTPAADAPALPDADALDDREKWLLTVLAEVTDEVERALDEFRFSDAANALYDFTWHVYCNVYLEATKPTIYKGTPEEKAAAQAVIAYSLDRLLRLLHPFIPFVTEEIWERLRAHLPAALIDGAPVLTVAPFPRAADMPSFDAERRAFQDFAVAPTDAHRSFMSASASNPHAKVSPTFVLARAEDVEVASRYRHIVCHMAGTVDMSFTSTDPTDGDWTSTLVGSVGQLFYDRSEIVDDDAERERLQKELARVDNDITHFKRKLDNPRFVANAPAEVVDKDRARLAEVEQERQTVLAALERLGG